MVSMVYVARMIHKTGFCDVRQYLCSSRSIAVKGLTNVNKKTG